VISVTSALIHYWFLKSTAWFPSRRSPARRLILETNHRLSDDGSIGPLGVSLSVAGRLIFLLALVDRVLAEAGRNETDHGLLPARLVD